MTETQEIRLTVTQAQVHKAVRNLLINELGVTRQALEAEVHALVERQVAQILEAHVLNSKMLEGVLRQLVVNYIQHGVNTTGWPDKRESFDRYAAGVIRDVIRDEIVKRFDFSVTSREGEAHTSRPETRDGTK